MPVRRARAFILVALVLGLVAPRAATALPPACAEDDALSEAALALLLDGTRAPSVDELAAALRAAGAEAPSARGRTFASGDEASAGAWVSALAARADAPLFCGEAEDGEHRLVLAAEIGGRIEALGEPPTHLRVRVHRSLERPHLVIEDAEGHLARLAVDGDGAGGRVELPEELAFPLKVQLVAEGRRGPRPVAERIVAGTAVSAAADVGPSTDGDGDVPSRVAALRAHHGASVLRPNRLLDAEATAHAANVCREGRAAHRLADGDPEERLARRGLSARVVGETVARAATVGRALSALADSPSHRMTLVDRRFTDAGYGVASDGRGSRCVVVLLAAWPRALAR